MGAALVAVFGLVAAASGLDFWLNDGELTRQAFTAIGLWMTSEGSNIWDFLLALVPDQVATDWSAYTPYVNYAAQWIPIDTALLAVTAYFTFVGIYITVKMIIKLIPFVG